MKQLISTAAVTLTLSLAQSGIANAAEIHVWTARAIATVLAEIGPQFERTTGHHLNVYSGLPVDFDKRVKAGDPLDVLISGSSPVDRWIKEGKLVATTRTDVARSGIGVEVRAGARKPDISSVEAFKRALRDAKSIAYLRVGSGLYLHGLLERLGVAEAVKSKVTRPESDIVSELVAKGEVELGMVVITQILTTPGVELVGPLPPEIQSYVAFVAGVSANSKAPDAAMQLIKFLTGPTAIPVIRAQGMEPATDGERWGSCQIPSGCGCCPYSGVLPTGRMR
jgi:molybdate transport system substrate-binding protein